MRLTNFLAIFMAMLIVVFPVFAEQGPDGISRKAVSASSDGASVKPAARPSQQPGTPSVAPRKYLNLGAAPQDIARQPQEGEVVVIVDRDICDPAWGSSKGPVAGCYPKHTAVYAKDGYVTAVVYCGNVPSTKISATGKEIQLPVREVEVEVEVESKEDLHEAILFQLNALREDLRRQTPPSAPVVSNVINIPPAQVVASPTSVVAEPFSAKASKKGFCSSRGCKVALLVIGAGTAAGLGFALRGGGGGNKTVTYQPLPPPIYYPHP